MHNFAGEKLKELLDKNGVSFRELALQTEKHPAIWSQVINGTKRLSVDLAIRLSKTFPETGNVQMWLTMQFNSDLLNAKEQDGPMYRNIKPFKE